MYAHTKRGGLDTPPPGGLIPVRIYISSARPRKMSRISPLQRLPGRLRRCWTLLDVTGRYLDV